ncbi:hypothetical protein [Streptomyces sp. NPDC086777]|uniref:hypothetical protein n=1 Tax=Streptomyces sp. NPDC086777 TaxID=3154866 RepID=UPI00344CFCF4
MWQHADPVTRFDPQTVYGAADPEDPMWFARRLGPWDGSGRMRPWSAPEFEEEEKNYLDLSVVTPPQYDTIPPVGNGAATGKSWMTCGTCLRTLPFGKRSGLSCPRRAHRGVRAGVPADRPNHTRQFSAPSLSRGG